MRCDYAVRLASSRSHHGIVRMLFDHGEGADAQTGNSASALQLASSKGDQETVRLLLKNGTCSITRTSRKENVVVSFRRRRIVITRKSFDCCWTRERKRRLSKQNTAVLWRRSRHEGTMLSFSCCWRMDDHECVRTA